MSSRRSSAIADHSRRSPSWMWTRDPELARQIGLKVPVLLLDGSVICHYTLNSNELLRLLGGLRLYSRANFCRRKGRAIAASRTAAGRPQS